MIGFMMPLLDFANTLLNKEIPFKKRKSSLKGQIGKRLCAVFILLNNSNALVWARPLAYAL